jgi:hypothetical protein
MKTPVCCVIFFFCVATMTQAQDSQPKASAQQFTAQNSTSSLVNSSPNLATNETERGCYYLRVYKVRRPYRDSDVTVPSGYTVCTASANRELKNAVETRIGPDVGK